MNASSIVSRVCSFCTTLRDYGIHADDTLVVHNGTIEIASSYEGLEASTIIIHNGIIRATAQDDGINGSATPKSSSLVQINGGTIMIDAEGDGFDSNGNFEVNGGENWVLGPTVSQNSSLDADGSFQLNGGFLLSTSGGVMAEEVGQNTAQYYAYIKWNTPQSGNLAVDLPDGNRMELSPQTEFGRAKLFRQLVVTHPSFAPGRSFSLSIGGASHSLTISNSKRSLFQL